MSAQKPNPRRRLGRGLDALIGGFGAGADPQPAASGSELVPADDASEAADKNLEAPPSQDASEAQLVSVESILPNPYQPRSDFDEKSLEELTESIRKHGVLQPVTVRRVDGGFQLIMGERRWQASRRAGLTEIPCWVRDFEDKQVAEAALEENLKRKDLNVLEKAQAYQDYVDRFGCKIGELAKRLSMDRSSVSNTLRLLDLPDKLKSLLVDEKITAGHAKALLPLEHDHQLAVVERVIAENLNVRKTEQAVRAILNSDNPDIVAIDSARKKPGRSKPEMTPHVESLEKQLRDLLGLKVAIRLKTAESGQVVIEFGGNDDFERLTRFLRKVA